MKLKNVKKINRLFPVLIVMLLCSCKKQIKEYLPGPEAAGINFYNASEVMNSAADLRKDNYVFINDSVANGVFKQFPKYADVYTPLSDLRQYPYNRTGTIFNQSGVISDRYQYIYYMPIALGTYKFIYSGPNKIFLKDMSVTLNERDELNALYLVESPEADNTYRVINVPEAYKGTPGKVRIRFVHLGTDSKEFVIKRADANGQDIASDLPKNLPFGGFSDYVELDTAGTSSTSKNFVFKIYDVADPSKQVLSTAVPAEPNGSFVVLIQGFRQTTTRRIPTGYANGSTTYQTVNISPNFRINLRRTY
jgi:hypothetical protein